MLVCENFTSFLEVCFGRINVDLVSLDQVEVRSCSVFQYLLEIN